MKSLYNKVAYKCSCITTKSYSTSFSMGINFLHRKFHDPICGIYGFVRFADEIVDTFHDHDQKDLIERFKSDTYKSIEEGISLNPILHSFQDVVNHYSIERELIETFFNSMEMDLQTADHNRLSYDNYVLGSAEVVGLMCLRVFTENDRDLYSSLKPGAMKLGSAFQKVNFLRDLKSDYESLGRVYFPNVDMTHFSNTDKKNIESEIEQEFNEAFVAIKQLPASSRLGVYLAYKFYRKLFNKIKKQSAEKVKTERIRISNGNKLGIVFKSLVRHQMNIL